MIYDRMNSDFHFIRVALYKCHRSLRLLVNTYKVSLADLVSIRNLKECMRKSNHFESTLGFRTDLDFK